MDKMPDFSGKRNGDRPCRQSDNDRVVRAVQNKWAQGVMVYVLPAMVAIIGYLVIDIFQDMKKMVRENTTLNAEQTTVMGKIVVRLDITDKTLESHAEWLKSLSARIREYRRATPDDTP